jgi:predicted kinase
MSIMRIIRGNPGSGKSTLAKTFNSFHFEADMSITRDDQYCWKPETVKMSHELVHDLVDRVMKSGADVTVSNTFTTLKEFANYKELAKKYGYQFVVIRCTGEYGNTHNVPELTIIRMKTRFEDYDGEVVV